MRPASIVNFERLYLAVIVLGVVNFFLAWDANEAMLLAQSEGMLGGNLLYLAVAAVIGVQLLLWYLVARRASVVAKWIIILWFLVGLAWLLRSLLSGTSPSLLTTLLVIGTTVLEGLAVWMLFRPDAKGWFSGGAARPNAGVLS